MVIFIAVFILILTGLYLILIMPRLFNRPDKSSLMGVFYAHRGLHDNKTAAPENSMSSFIKAVEARYGIELDVQLTKDDVLVVFHDETLNRMCSDNGKVIDYTFDELQAFKLGDSDELIPTFEDVLNVVSGKIPLIIEIKMHSACTKVCVATNKALENYQGPYCIESFHPVAVRWYRKNRPDVIRGQLSSNFKKEMGKESLSHFIVHHLLTNFMSKPDFIAYGHHYHKGLSRRLCQKLYQSFSVAWTIKSQVELDACRDQFDLFIFEGFIPDQT